ncbi:MAG: zinc ribbon domain-containing protein [Anaerolineales bacterium]|nr:zinc ribbon domain-containing protein [Anaerolineales bacterium]
MKKVNWTAVVIFTIVALLILQVAGYLLGGSRYGGWGMMGPGMMGGWSFSPFGWIGMAFMWLIPIGFLVLTVLGIVWLVRTIGGGNNPSTHAQVCPSCGRGAQADWSNCPHCGASLVK